MAGTSLIHTGGVASHTAARRTFAPSPLHHHTSQLRPLASSGASTQPSSSRSRKVRDPSPVDVPPSPAIQEPAPASSTRSQRQGDSGKGSSKDAVGEDWRREVLAALAQAEGFAELTIRAKVASAQPWHTITVRPISLRGSRHLQVTTFTARQSTSANHPAAAGDVAAAEAVVGPLLAAGGIGSVAVRTAEKDLAVQITKRGKGIVHRSSPQSRPALVGSTPGRMTSHDRPKDTPIPADQPHPFLQKIGFQTADGRIRANMQDKFSQVNEFLKLLGHTDLIRDLAASAQQQQRQPQGNSSGATATTASPPPASSPSPSPSPPSSSPAAPLHILDCGCGSSHLSFGTYHYLNHVLGVPATLGGVDVNAALMGRANENAAQLGLEGVRFDTAPIGEYRPPVRPDIVLALHACDTATDDALALAVKQRSPLIMAVPCCHAHMHKQLAGRPPSSRPPWGPLLRHGILKQRQLDLLTDTMRAQLLRVAGYRTDVVEFVSTEHTPRNLLIRAVRERRGQPPPPPPPQQQPRPHPHPHHDQQQRNTGLHQGTGSGQHQQLSGEAMGPEATAAAPSPPSAPSTTPSAAPHNRPSPLPRHLLAAAREYLELRDHWGVTPRLEVLLEAELRPLLAAAARMEDTGGDEDGQEDEEPGAAAWSSGGDGTV